ncbi:MAG: hypothetical protein L6R40_004738 [Gallowayella cf. fulva]|nr:MAG: hypothetical protein L6R40_004738 [Xanthomendoza cf. fulva]
MVSTPVHSFWDLGVPGHCVNIDQFFIASGSVNVVLDFIIFILPIPLLWRLRTSLNQKLILTAIFTVAGFVVIVSIVRVVVLSRLTKTDITWNFINGGIWAETEPSVAVICACLPSLRPLFTVAASVRSKLYSNSSSTNSQKSSKWLMWGGSGLGSKGFSSSGFESMNEGEDEVNLPMGHNVDVYGGATTGDAAEGGELPERGIRVKTEVVLVSSARLDYRDRLF